MSTGKTYILIAAVEHYNEAADFPRVRYAANDATELQTAFLQLGYDPADIVVLTDAKATKVAILYHIKRFCDYAKENDRVIFYFAGHGFYEDGQNLLAGADAFKANKPATCVSINEILGHFKKSACKHNIMFLDCCHSGFEAGETVRAGADSFETETLIYQFSKEEYSIGFAACKTHESSHSDHRLNHGIWSHFLITALLGEAGKIYRKGLLFSDALQAYLNEQTTEFVKLHVDGKPDQTPIKFGSETNKFIIADVNPILHKKTLAKKSALPQLQNVSLLRSATEQIKTLTGFKKGFHHVPNGISTHFNRFVQDISNEMIETDISEVAKKLQQFGYKRTQVSSKTDRGYGSILTPDFNYSITINQSEDDPAYYTLVKQISDIRNPAILTDKVFNTIFYSTFNTVSFEFDKPIDLNKVIDAIEDLDSEEISVEYDSSQLTWCTITFDGLDHEVKLFEDVFEIYTGYSSPPCELVKALRETRNAMLNYEATKLLSQG